MDINLNKLAIILRSVSGAGKSTFAELLKQNWLAAGKTVVIASVDDYYIEKYGEYRFVANEVVLAHEYCQNKFKNALTNNNTNLVVCANTNSREYEREFYADLAKSAGYTTFSLIVENINNTENIHNIPAESIERQKFNLLQSIKLT